MTTKATKEMKTRFAATLFAVTGILAFSILIRAQAPASGPVLKLIATSDNVSSAGESIKINLNQWSTDAERDQFVAAWTLAPSARGGRGGAAGRGGGAGAAGGGGGGAARGAPAAAPEDVVPDLPTDPDAVVTPAPARGGGGGGGGRGGRGGNANATPVTPASSLLTALQAAPLAGYIWTSEVTGYAIRYAYKLPLPTGGQRIILATDRRLGAASGLWKSSAASTPTDYEFTVIELRMNPKGDGEGKASLTGKVTVDQGSKSIALDGYDALPVVLKTIKAQ